MEEEYTREGMRVFTGVVDCYSVTDRGRQEGRGRPVTLVHRSPGMGAHNLFVGMSRQQGKTYEIPNTFNILEHS